MEAHALGLLVSVLVVIKGLSLSSAARIFPQLAFLLFQLNLTRVFFFQILLKSEHNYCPCCVVNLEEYGMLHFYHRKDGTFVVRRTFVSFSNERASVPNSNVRPQM